MAIKALDVNITPRIKEAFSGLSLSAEHQRFLLHAVVIAFAVRIALVAAAYVAGYIQIGRDGVPPGAVFEEIFAKWDGDNFLRLAEFGYQSEGEQALYLVYLPLYPYAVKLLYFFIPSYLVAGLLLSAVAAVAAGFFLQVLMRQDGMEAGDANRGLLYMSLFPTAYFLALPYSEATFLATALASFAAARSNHWGWAGVMAALATATRIQAVAILPALALEAVIRYRWQVWRRAYWLALAPVGLLVYLGINWYVAGDPLQFVEIQRTHWFQTSVTPWKFMRDTINAIQNLEPGYLRAGIYEMRLISVIVAVTVLLAGIRVIPASYQVFAWATLLFMMSSSWQISMPRYLLGMFPLFIILAYYGRNQNVHQAILAVFPLLMGVFFVMYATRFGF
jgi:hypothetical protein